MNKENESKKLFDFTNLLTAIFKKMAPSSTNKSRTKQQQSSSGATSNADFSRPVSGNGTITHNNTDNNSSTISSKALAIADRILEKRNTEKVAKIAKMVRT